MTENQLAGQDWINQFHLQHSELPAQLREDVFACNYYPQLVCSAVELALGGEECVAWLVHHDAAFNNEEIHRHLTVLALTPTRLIIDHTDDGDHSSLGQNAITSTEVVNLANINSVSLSQVVSNPEDVEVDVDSCIESWLTIGWSVMNRIELEPAACGNPECEADHGYSGALMADDLTIRMSEAADGKENVKKLIHFATCLQQTTSGRR